MELKKKSQCSIYTKNSSQLSVWEYHHITLNSPTTQQKQIPMKLRIETIQVNASHFSLDLVIPSDS